MSNPIMDANEEYFSDAADPEPQVLSSEILTEPIRRLEPVEPVAVDQGTTAAEAIRLMQERRIGCVLVTGEGRLLGIFTERDVLQVVGTNQNVSETPVAQLMTSSPETLGPDSPIAYALNKMSLGGFRHVPLVDDEGHPVGIISVKDIVDYIVSFFPNEILTIPPEPGLDIPRSREGA